MITIDKHGNMNGHYSVSPIYQFKGMIFEMHRYLGPIKLKKDMEPAAAMGRKFWEIWDEWSKLTSKQKSKTEI